MHARTDKQRPNRLSLRQVLTETYTNMIASLKCLTQSRLKFWPVDMFAGNCQETKKQIQTNPKYLDDHPPGDKEVGGRGGGNNSAMIPINQGLINAHTHTSTHHRTRSHARRHKRLHLDDGGLNILVMTHFLPQARWSMIEAILLHDIISPRRNPPRHHRGP